MEINAIFRSLEIDKKLVIQCKGEEKMEAIITRFAQKAFADPKDYFYFYGGKEINKEITLMKLICNNKNLKEIEITINRRNKIIKCPKCICNNCILKIDNYRLNFSDCVNNHEDIRLFEEYDDTQRINYQKIKFDQCNRTQKDSLEEFYKCLKCSSLAGYAQYICNECNKIHKHKTIKYDEKYYYCPYHYSEYISYCENCNCNLCEGCEKKHKAQNHEIKTFDSMSPDIKDIKKKLDKIDEKIEDLKTIVKIIKNKMDGSIKIIENYHSIAQDMIKKYETFNSRLKNYQILKTINYLFISNREIINDIENIINGNKSKDDWKKKCNILIDIIEGDRSDYKNENAKTNLNTDDSFYINKIYSEENYINEFQYNKEKKSNNISGKRGISNDKNSGKTKQKGMQYNKSNIGNK